MVVVQYVDEFFEKIFEAPMEIAPIEGQTVYLEKYNTTYRVVAVCHMHTKTLKPYLKINVEPITGI